MSAGYIYILSNDSMPGIVKIGRSERGGRSRAKELYTTGVAKPFVLRFELFAHDSIKLEKFVHERLEENRCSNKREFFDVAVEEAIRIILDEYASYFYLRCSHRDEIVTESDIDRYVDNLWDHKDLPGFLENPAFGDVARRGDEIADALKNIENEDLIMILKKWVSKAEYVDGLCRRIVRGDQ